MILADDATWLKPRGSVRIDTRDCIGAGMDLPSSQDYIRNDVDKLLRFAPDKPVEITFATAELREICQFQDTAEQFLSRLGAKKLRTIVASMRAAATAAELMSVHVVTPGESGFSAELSKAEILRVQVGQLSIPKKEDCIDWGNVYRVKIISIEGTDV